MTKKPPKHRNKPRFCFDVNAQFRYLNKECNQFGTYTSSVQLLKNQKAKDADIIEYCNKFDYHVITHNKHNFKDYQHSTKIGIIYIGNQNPKYWLNSFKGIMNKYPNHQDLYYTTINIISNKVETIDRRKRRS